ncbi:MAG: hypothetical protein Q7S28_01875, partial [bacterium]|nr:hypothetical protein [bacterium]
MERKKSFKHFLVAISLLLVFIGGLRIAHAATGVPRILNYQGRLYDASGNLLGGLGTSYCFRFSLYDDATVGAPDNRLWPSVTSSDMTANVRNGVFSVGIGDTSAGGDTLTYNFQDSDTIFLNVEVSSRVGGACGGGDESYETLSPRQRVFSAGYALNAGALQGFSASQEAATNTIPVLTSSGALILAGANAQLNATSTNALTLQGGTGTGNIQFFGASNFITSTGTLNIAGLLQSANIDQYLTIASTPTFGGLNLSGVGSFGGFTFANATGTGNLQVGTFSVTNSATFGTVSSTGITFTNATGSGNLQIATLNSTGNIDIAGVLQAGSSNVNLTLGTGFIDSAALTLATSGVSGATSSNAGLEVIGNSLTLLKGCAADEILKWDESGAIWKCAADEMGVGGPGGDGSWTTNGGTVSLVTSTNQVGIGATSTLAKLFIRSTSPGTSTLYVQGLDGQTANILTVVSSSGNNYFSITAGGLLQAGSSNVNLTLGTGYIDANALTLAPQGATTATTSFTGLEVASSGLSIIKGCAANQILKWSSANVRWECQDDLSSVSEGGGSIITEEGNATAVATTTNMDFAAADFVVTPDGPLEADISIDYASSGITRAAQNENISGEWRF